jgi:pyridoxal phosphate enzyme (YggS family)
MSTIAANLQAIRRRISEALQGDRREITLLAVSKSQPGEKIREAHAAGCGDFGENYVQESVAKMAALADLRANWHFIGHLQANKAREVAERFDWVHSVDRLRLAQALDRSRPASRGPLRVCVQVNISGEDSKSGVAPGEALALAREVSRLPGLRLRGLMGMAAYTDDVAEQHAQFRKLRECFEGLRAAGLEVDTLSMGMSADLEAAIAEGSTLVRVGTAIFGERTKRAAA